MQNNQPPRIPFSAPVPGVPQTLAQSTPVPRQPQMAPLFTMETAQFPALNRTQQIEQIKQLEQRAKQQQQQVQRPQTQRPLATQPRISVPQPMSTLKSVAAYNTAALGNQGAVAQPRPSTSSSLLYSPTFQCFTSLPFYAALMLELVHMTKAADQKSSTCREVIWSQLFVLVGVKHRCSQAFTPVVESWASSPNINLLAVELLYLAFSLSLMRYPKLLGDDERFAQSPFGIIQDPLRDLVNPFTEKSTNLATNVSRKRKIEQLPSQQPTPAPKPPPPQPAPTQPVPQQQPQTQKSTQAEEDCTQQLESLKSWVTDLESLTEEQRGFVWSTCSMLPQWPGRPSSDSFHIIIDTWASDVPRHQASIKILFSVIGYLKYQGTIPANICIPLKTPTKSGLTSSGGAPTPVSVVKASVPIVSAAVVVPVSQPQPTIIQAVPTPVAAVALEGNKKLKLSENIGKKFLGSSLEALPTLASTTTKVSLNKSTSALPTTTTTTTDAHPSVASSLPFLFSTPK